MNCSGKLLAASQTLTLATLRTIRSKQKARSWRLGAFPFQLLLPPENPSLVPLSLCFWNHPFFLIEHRQAGMGEHVIRIQFRDALGNHDSFIKALQILQGA